MLVLKRQKGKRVFIHRGGEVLAIVSVCGLESDRVKLGFEAERDIGIDREEVYEANMRAASQRPAEGPELN